MSQSHRKLFDSVEDLSIELDHRAAKSREKAKKAKRPDLRRKWQGHARIFEMTRDRINRLLYPGKCLRRNNEVPF